ncbi:MAG: L,D-transpeptidase family protein [Alphaproteobacteria bacterium]
MRSVFLSVFLILFAVPALAAYDKPYIGETKEYRAKYEDTFVHIARDYNLGFVEMRAANPGVDPWIPGKGRELILPTRHLLPDALQKGIVINLPEMRLYYYGDGNQEPETFPIGIGREGLDTPLGVTKVVRKTAGPTWTPTARMRKEKPELPPFMGPGPENPMGTHALYLGFPLVAIHGTNRSFGIGRRISSGCIRLYPEDIIRLYEVSPVGMTVNVVDQPVKLAWIGDELYLEAHPDVAQSIHLEETGQIQPEKLSPKEVERIVRVAGDSGERLNWPAIRKAVRDRPGYPIMIARRAGHEPVASAEEMLDKKEAAAALKEDTAQAMEKIYDGSEESIQPVTYERAAEDARTYRTLNP